MIMTRYISNQIISSTVADIVNFGFLTTAFPRYSRGLRSYTMKPEQSWLPPYWQVNSELEDHIHLEVQIGKIILKFFQFGPIVLCIS